MKDLWTDRVLLVYDREADVGNAVQRLRQRSNNLHLCLCPIDGGSVGGVLEERVRRECGGRVEDIPFNRLFHEMAFQMREPYLEWIQDLSDAAGTGRVDWREYFRWPGAPGSLWDLSLIPEKSVWKSNLFAHLVRTRVLEQVIESRGAPEVWLDIRDPDLREVWTRRFVQSGVDDSLLRPAGPGKDVRMILRSLREVLRWLAQEIGKMRFVGRVLPDRRGRKARFREVRDLFITYFPLVDEVALRRKVYRNLYFAPLQDALEAEDRNGVGWVAMIVNVEGYDFGSSVKLAGELARQGRRFSIIKEWVRWTDLIWAVCVALFAALKTLLTLRQIRQVRYQEDLLVWPFLRNDWISSFAGLHLIMTLVSYRAFRNLFRELQPARVYYAAELHAWERALNLAKNAISPVTTIGIQHASTPLLNLNYHYDRREYALEARRRRPMFPDYLATVGESSRQGFLGQGWDAHRVFTLGGIRFTHYPGLSRRRLPWAERRNKVVVALSISAAESALILEWLMEAFGSTRDIQFVVKGHPSCPLEPILKKRNLVFPEETFRFTRDSVSGELLEAKALCVGSPSLAFEALACACPIVVLRTPVMLDVSPLSGSCDLQRYAHHPREWRQVLEAILGSPANPIPEDQADEILRKFVYCPISEDEFLSRIRSACGGHSLRHRPPYSSEQEKASREFQRLGGTRGERMVPV